MDEAMVDRLARAVTKTVSRRWLFPLIGAAVSMLGQQRVRGFQLGPATCGEEGAVCTHVSRCCDGLTCVTSAINTNYGICVPGEGGMISTGTTLISPFSETAVEEVSALMPTASTAPATTDPEAEREAHVAAVRSRRDTKRTERETRLDTRRANVRRRKDKARNRRREAREPAKAARGPQLQLKLLFRKADPDSGVVGDPLVPIEVVRVTNRDDVKVVLTRIEPIKGDLNGVDLITSQFTLGPGETYSFVAGLPTEDAAEAGKDKFLWVDKVACNGSIPRQGYRVKAAYSRGEENHDFVVRCGGTHTTGAIESAAATPRHKRKKSTEDKHKRNIQHRKKKRR